MTPSLFGSPVKWEKYSSNRLGLEFIKCPHHQRDKIDLFRDAYVIYGQWLNLAVNLHAVNVTLLNKY